MEKLIELAKKILAANPDGRLSGSLALRIQGIKTRRDVEDIDIWIPGAAKIIEGMEAWSSSQDQYEEDSFSRDSYMIDGVQIDFFTPLEYPEVEPHWRMHEGIPVLLPYEIMKFKLQHGFDDTYLIGQEKHLEDLIFMIKDKIETINNPIDIEF